MKINCSVLSPFTLPLCHLEIILFHFYISPRGKLYYLLDSSAGRSEVRPSHRAALRQLRDSASCWRSPLQCGRLPVRRLRCQPLPGLRHSLFFIICILCCFASPSLNLLGHSAVYLLSSGSTQFIAHRASPLVHDPQGVES